MGAAAGPTTAEVCGRLAELAAQLNTTDLRGLRVLLRSDLNVPLLPSGAVSDEARIAASLPAIKLLLSKGARVAICSHLGRPDATSPDQDAQRRLYTLAPVAAVLLRLLGAAQFVGLAPDCVGPQARAAVDALQDGQAVLLENVRFHAGETSNDAAFAGQLAELVDAYVGDAFGVTHRDQASVTCVPSLLPRRYPGPLVALEVANYLATMERPRRPLGVAIGGAKVKDQIGVLRSLIGKADVIAVGGRMAFTFLAGRGVSVGATQIEDDWVEPAREMIKAAAERGVRLLLPVDVLVSQSLDKAESPCIVELTTTCCTHEAPCIPAGCFGVDIGPASSAQYRSGLAGCNTLLWNGPMGKFEVPEFAEGTTAMVETLSEATRRGAATCLGGGDTLSAFHQAGHGAAVGFASTGGGASLELLEGRAMPGLRALLP